jgi:hypothetical protein
VLSKRTFVNLANLSKDLISYKVERIEPLRLVMVSEATGKSGIDALTSNFRVLVN